MYNIPGAADDADIGDMWLLDFTSMANLSAPIIWINVTNRSDPNWPIAVDGGRMVVDTVGKYAYRFGGYRCILNGMSASGGVGCQLNLLYRLTLANMSWTLLPTKSNAPSLRQYHGTAYHNRRIFVIGGAFQDGQGNWYYYNDVHAYDVVLNDWLTVVVHGTPMNPVWSFAAKLLNNAIWTFAGCSSPGTFYNNLASLQLDVVLLASNFYAFGKGVYAATSAVQTFFTVAVRNSTQVNSLNLQSSYVWGAPILWATSLDFSIVLVGTSNSDGSTIVQEISKADTSAFIDNQDSTYNLSYTLTSGSSYQMFITYKVNGVTNAIPGSPFLIDVFPGAIQAARSSCYGTGLITPVQGHFAYFYLVLRDQYSNPVNASVDSLQWLTFAINDLSALFDSSTLSLVGVHDAGNLYSVSIIRVRYYVLMSGSYSLSVNYSNSSVSGSPFSVSAYVSVEVSSSLELGAFAFCIVCLVFVCCCMVGVTCFWNHPVIKASSLNLMLLTGVGCLFAIAGVWIRVYVEKLTNIECIISPWLIGTGFVFACGCIFFKTYRISKIFASHQLQIIKIGDFELLRPVLALFILESSLQILRYYLDPATVQTYSLSSNSLLTYQACGSKNLWFSFALYGYKAVLLCFGVYLGVVSRNVPALFNESTILSFLIFNIFFISALVLPLSLSIEVPSAIYGLEVFGVLWGVFSTVFALFVPKALYILDTQAVVPTGVRVTVPNLGLSAGTSSLDSAGLSFF